MLATVTGTIKQGESVSAAIDCAGRSIVLISIPPEFTPITPTAPGAYRASLTFQVSADGDGYHDLHLADGREVEVIALHPDITIAIPPTWGRDVNFLKIRAGRRNNPIVQGADCNFSVAVRA